MATVPTMVVWRKDGMFGNKPVIINESDFNPKHYMKWENKLREPTPTVSSAPKTPKKEPAATKEKSKSGDK